MTDKPNSLLATAMGILRVGGEDAARLWYDNLSEEQQAQLRSELATVTTILSDSFREIGKIFQRQSEAMISAFRSFLDAVEDIEK